MIRLEHSLLNIMVSCTHTENASFVDAVPIALREYADAVERGIHDDSFTGKNPKSIPPVCGKLGTEEMEASNGCLVQVIAGSYSILGNDQGSRSKPLASIRDRMPRIVESS